MGILLLVCAIVIIGLMWFRLGSGPAPLEVYSLTDLSIEEVSEYLEMYPAGILINDSKRGIKDTVTSLTEFLALIPEATELPTNPEDPFDTNLSLDTLTLIEEVFPEAESAELSPAMEEELKQTSQREREPTPQRENAPKPSPRPASPSRKPAVSQPNPATSDVAAKPQEKKAAPREDLKPFEIEVSGERVQGSPLTISIPEYDPGVSYFMDYGNGTTQRVRKRHVFAFEEPGNFQMKLIAIEQASGRRSTYAENVTIMPSLNEPVVAETPEEPVPNVEDTLTSDNPTELPAATPPPAGPAAALEEQPNEPLSDRGVIDEAGPLEGDASQEEFTAPETSGPLKIVEVLPSFPGGLSALNQYIQREQDYPRIARENGIHGKVYLQFVVTETGQIEDLQILRGIGYGCDEEAVRLVKSMPSWIPGRQGGRSVPVLYTLPISFKLN